MLIFSCFVIINAFSCAYNNIFIVIYTKTWSYVIDLVFKFAILLEWRPWLTPYCPDLNMLPDSYCRYFLNEIWFKLCIICRFLLREDLLLWLIVWFFISKSRIFHQGHGLLRKKNHPISHAGLIYSSCYLAFKFAQLGINLGVVLEADRTDPLFLVRLYAASILNTWSLKFSLKNVYDSTRWVVLAPVSENF